MDILLHYNYNYNYNYITLLLPAMDIPAQLIKTSTVPIAETQGINAFSKLSMNY